MQLTRPAILGGAPILTDPVPLARPTLDADPDLLATFRDVLSSGIVTKGRHLAELEREVADFLGVGHAVLVSSCTSGLMLTLRCLDLHGEVVLPSFTFMASGHAVVWNGLEPVFADIDPHTFAVDPERVADEVTDRTAALLAVHTFGSPCDVDALAKIAAERGVPLVVDAAAAFGGRYPDGSPVGGRGTAEVFSLSPTKPFTTGEGGIVATNDGELARELRVGRDYGNAGDYDSRFVGLNARMPELSAVLGRHHLPLLPALIERRQELADRYRAGLSGLPGIGFQRVPPGARSTYKDLCLTVSASGFGLDRDTLAAALRAEGVATRAYFDPPLHRQTAYRRFAASGKSLPHSEELAGRALAVPLYSHLPEHLVDRICEVVRRIHEHAAEITARTAPDAG
ncbi:dTDP-4-amino-4,6-dideoxygalactose transaminase [Saccharothrix tamanrassetensis]|uniref:dTDP-4-amino-4,6-dideoxygalactose transaminase n=1 Tax=Saccharothrix tamanrassetensis TaxID=1051531 RepID=A0A841C8I4_9PSEU|nr:DegT/DnrJ/EryC1/StrS family aminotransferase [Saccharothrix tamanrassetensis]MBB5953719.1 dTDP-4-amino-4,6-dideoxygalactose transaminase [Saccharothrix tamanrassetensis]